MRLFEKWNSRSGSYERDRIDAVRGFATAARRSSEEVVAALWERLRVCKPGLDAMMLFLPEAHELRPNRCYGRATMYGEIRVRRDDETHLIAQVARNRYSLVLSPTQRVIPGDHEGIAIPIFSETELHAVLYLALSRVPFASQSIGHTFRSTSSPLHDGSVRDWQLCVDTVEDASVPYVLAVERERDRASARYDGLTGLLAPRAFRMQVREEVERLGTGAGELSVWFIDTDRFKYVNDTFGHATGDRVLQQMATILRAHAIPDYDFAARNGGDEFCVLARGTLKTRAIERAQGFCEAVAAYDFGIGIQLGASVGVASYPVDGVNANALLEVADGAMYHSKRSGRSCVSFALADGTFLRYQREHFPMPQ